MTEQGYPPRQRDQAGRGRPRAPQETRRTDWQTLDAFDPVADDEVDLPPWAGPRVEPVRPARRTPRSAPPSRELPEPPGEPERVAPRRVRMPGRSRAADARRRRFRRRLTTWGGAAVVIVIIAGAVYFLTRTSPAPSPFVTSLQKGEYSRVQNACRVLPTATLSQYLGGRPTQVQPFNYGQNSQCSYTVDAKPTFRVLELTMQAYQPDAGLIPGNGSATANAKYTFSRQRELLAKPPKHTPQPPAMITTLRGFGDQAFSGVQVFHSGHTTDLVTVLVRYRNVLITAKIQAQVSDGFGPVAISTLEASAVGAARDLLATIKAQPVVG